MPREKERERETEKEIERVRERDRARQRQSECERATERETKRETVTETERERERERERESKRDIQQEWGQVRKGKRRKQQGEDRKVRQSETPNRERPRVENNNFHLQVELMESQQQTRAHTQRLEQSSAIEVTLW